MDKDDIKIINYLINETKDQRIPWRVQQEGSYDALMYKTFVGIYGSYEITVFGGRTISALPKCYKRKNEEKDIFGISVHRGHGGTWRKEAIRIRCPELVELWDLVENWCDTTKANNERVIKNQLLAMAKGVI